MSMTPPTGSPRRESALFARSLALLLLTALLAGCAATPGKDAPAGDDAPAADATPESTPDDAPAEPVEPRVVRIEPVRPQIELTEDLLFRLMLAEIAGQRGHLEISIENYMALARETRDPKIVERATRIAVFARDSEAATQAAAMWAELDPLNPDPHQVLAVMALRDGDMEKALEHLQQILDYAHGKIDQKLWMIANLLGREKDQQLVAASKETPEALYAFAHVAARLGELDRSAELLEETLELEPENDNVAMSYLSILQRQGRHGDAIQWLEETLPARSENDFNLRMAYARLLTDAKRFDEARRQFEILSVQAPNNPDVQYALGLLYLQSNRLDDAERSFRLLSENREAGSDASYYLGRIAEERGEHEQAGVWYEAVQDGENYFDAQVRGALLMARQGNVEEARAHLRQIRTNSAQEDSIIVQAEGELLTEEKRYEAAMGVYDEALDGEYNADLLYARAMLAEKMDRLDLLERDLLTIIDREPDHAQALNALGYTLADRTNRYQEALQYIEKALELSPGDFYILDSMGWVLYRLGRMGEAIDYLRKAIALRQDPEIAAHLGEVLWVMGDKDGAKEVWETALQATPEDRYLLDVIKRFNP